MSQSLWSRYNRHFVGITQLEIYRVIQTKVSLRCPFGKNQ